MNEQNDSQFKLTIAFYTLEKLLGQKKGFSWFSFMAGAAAMLVPFEIHLNRLPQAGFAAALVIVFVVAAKRR